MTLQVIYGNQIGNRILTGLAVDKPATGTVTEIFIATDTNQISYGTGSGWTLATDIAHNTGTGADHSFIDQSVISGASPTFDAANMTGVPQSSVDITIGGTPNIDNLEELMFHTGSVGIFHPSDGVITDEGATKFQIAAGEGLLRLTGTTTAPLISMVWSQTDILYSALVSGTVYYIYVENVVGTPTVQYTTNESNIDHVKDIDLGFIWYNGENLIVNNPASLYNLPDRQHESISEMLGYVRVQGAAISEPTNLKLALTASEWYLGFTEFLIDAIDTSVANTFTYFYQNTGVWTEVTGQTTIDVTNYNDTSSGLSALTVNRYGVHWVYLNANGGLYVVYGTGDYTISLAEAATIPTSLPPQFDKFCKIVGKVIVQKGAAAFYALESPFIETFTAGTATAHNDLGGLNDGDYKHLTAANFTDLTDSGDSTLHYHNADRLIANVTDMENQSFTNLLVNGDFESWPDGASSVPSGWVLGGSGASVARSVDEVLGDYSAELTRSGTNCYLVQSFAAELAFYKNSYLTIGCWVKSTSVNAAILIYDGIDSSRAAHSGSGVYEFLSTTKLISASASAIDIQCRLDTDNISVTFDSFMCVVGQTIGVYSDKPLSDDGKTIAIDSPTNTATIENLTVGHTLVKSVTNTITAYATGGQTSAVSLTSDINEVSVCASAGDSVKLPAALAGMEKVVINHGAAALDLFPVSGDFINEAAVDVATSIAIDATAICYCYTDDYWEVVEVGR